MRFVIFFTFILAILSCTDREESVGGLIGDYTHGDTSKVKITSVDIHDNNIQNNIWYTNVNPIQVVINANSQAQLMRLGLDTVCGDLLFVPFQSTNTMNLQENMSQTIYLQAKDTEDERTECFDYTIVHDNLAPNAPVFNNNPTTFFSDRVNRSARTRWTSTDNGPAGVDHYELAISTSSDSSDTSKYLSTGFKSTNTNNNTYYTGLSLAINTDYYSLVKTIDRATNESSISVSSAWRVYLAADQVENIILVESTHNSLEISWDEVTNDMGTPLVDYDIQYRVAGGTTWITFVDGVSTDPTTIITGLQPKTDYEIQVRGRNSYRNNDNTWSNTVTFSTLRTYKAYNLAGPISSKIVSFEDDNELTLNGTPLVSLGKQQTHFFGSTLFQVIEGTKPFYVAGALGEGTIEERANASWVHEDYPGRDFYVSHFEAGSLVVNVYALEAADVIITSGGNDYGVQSLSAGGTYSYNLSDKVSYHIRSTGNILAYTYATGDGNDYLNARALLPGSTDLVGTPDTSASILASTDTTYTISYSDGAPLFMDSVFFETPLGITSSTISIRVTAADPIDITSYDADLGQGASSFMPVSMMKKKYALNTEASSMMFISTSGGSITRIEPDGTPSSITLTGSGPYYYLLNASVQTGTLFESTNPFAVWYLAPNDTPVSAAGDETLLFGWDD